MTNAVIQQSGDGVTVIQQANVNVGTNVDTIDFHTGATLTVDAGNPRKIHVDIAGGGGGGSGNVTGPVSSVAANLASYADTSGTLLADSGAAVASVPTTGQKSALAGTSGTPGSGNKYVTDGDARNTNARTPTAHAASHATIGSDPIAPSDIGAEATANKGAANGYASLSASTKVPIAQIPTGTSGSTVPLGNDSRLSDARTPTAHATTHVTGGGDTIADAVSGGNSGLFSGADKAKLDGVGAGANVTSVAGKTGVVTLSHTTDLSNIGTNSHAAIDTFIASKAAASGLASLDGSTKVPIAQLPTGTSSSTVAIGNDSRITGAEQTANKGAASGYASLDSSSRVVQNPSYKRGQSTSVSTTLTTGTSSPLSITDATMTGLSAGGDTVGSGTVGVVAGSFASSAAETGSSAGQAGLGANSPLTDSAFAGKRIRATLKKVNDDDVLLQDILPGGALADLNSRVYGYLAFRSDLGADLKWRFWFYYQRQSDGVEVTITPTASLTNAILFVPQVFFAGDVPISSDFGADLQAGERAADIAPGSVTGAMLNSNVAGSGLTYSASTIADSTTKPLNYTFGASGTAIDVTNNMRVRGTGGLTLDVVAPAQGAAAQLADVNSRRYLLGSGIGGPQASLTGTLTDLFNYYGAVTSGGNITQPAGRGGIYSTGTINIQGGHTLASANINSGGANGGAGAGGTSPTSGGAGTAGTTTNHKTTSQVAGGAGGNAGAVAGAGGNGIASVGTPGTTQSGVGGGSGGGGGAAAVTSGAAGTTSVVTAATTRGTLLPGIFIQAPEAASMIITTSWNPSGSGCGGAGGGGGGGANGGGGGAGGSGGTGTASLMVSCDTLTISGSITVNGGDGVQGTKGTDGTSTSGGGGSGGGGGGGGGGVLGLRYRVLTGSGTTNGGNPGAARTTFGAGAGGGGNGGQGGAGIAGGAGETLTWSWT